MSEKTEPVKAFLLQQLQRTAQDGNAGVFAAGAPRRTPAILTFVTITPHAHYHTILLLI